MAPPDTAVALVPQPTAGDFPEFVSIPIRIAQHAKAFPGKRAVVCEGKTRSWGEFDKRVNKVARTPAWA
jgi:acyl-CoA synthetase (AMP-forming)/AMP-acid ligase II